MKNKKPSVKQMATEATQAAVETAKASGLIGDGTTVIVPVIVFTGIVSVQQGVEWEGGDTEG